MLLRDTADSVVVPQSGRLVAALGVRDAVVVDTPDALLVCARKQAQDIKAIVDELKRRGERTCYAGLSRGGRRPAPARPARSVAPSQRLRQRVGRRTSPAPATPR